MRKNTLIQYNLPIQKQKSAQNVRPQHIAVPMEDLAGKLLSVMIAL